MIKNINLKKIIAIILSGAITLELTGCGVSKETSQSTNNSFVNSTTVKEKNSTHTNNYTTTKEIESTTFEATLDPKDEYIATKIATYAPVDNIETEDDIIDFFASINDKVNGWISKDNFELVKKEVSSAVATFILFLSGDNAIGNYTFESLSDDTKNKVKVIFIALDTKLESKFPDYKTPICEISLSIKDFISEKYNDLSKDVRIYVATLVGNENYDSFIVNLSNGWIDLKDSFKNIKDTVIGWAKKKENK